MGENLSLMELLQRLASCSGDEAIDLVSSFQCGALTVEGISADEVDDS